MPWRLIIFIAVFAVFLVFISFNLENKCDISFGFAKLTEVPVFITIFTSFILGLLCSLPLLMHIKKSRAEKPHKNIKANIDDSESSSGEPIDPAEARKRFRARHGDKKK